MNAVIYKKRLVWRIKLVAKNGETIMNSEAYYSRGNANRALLRLKEFIK